VDGLEAPLTGRDAELRTVRELFHAAAGRRVLRLVLVAGPAGVGKSRLGWEFEKYLDGLAEEVWWHRGRCLSYGEGVAFGALAEMVRQRLGIAEEDPAEVAAGKLAAGLDRFVPDPAGALGISHEYLQWAWPLAACTALDLADTATATGLLAMLDGYQPGELAPCCASNPTWSAPAWPQPTAARPPPQRSPLRSSACAGTPPPTIWPTA
jgi:hypothetical protein